MDAFRRRALLVFLALLTLSLVVGAACYRRSVLAAVLLPGPGDSAPWTMRPEPDASPGGRADVRLLDAGRRLRVRLEVAGGAAYPFAAANLFFTDRVGQILHADLSRYGSISFVATCAPANTLSLIAPTFEEHISTRGDLLTYRSPSGFFACSERGARVELDLTRMETPQWWFAMFGLDLSRQSYRLDQVPKLAIGSTFQSPRDVPLVVDLSAIVLHGRDWRWVGVPGALLLLVWVGVALWFFRAHARALTLEPHNKRQKDLPIVAYQQLSLEPHRDREKSAILQAIASRFAESDLDLEAVVQDAGVNRNKVNEVLKSELGFTFTGYLNKLRLNEAARLLAERGAASISEIAYTVGYSNVSYFNKLFKLEYGCTPKAFRAALGNPAQVEPETDTPATNASTIRMGRATPYRASG